MIYLDVTEIGHLIKDVTKEKPQKMLLSNNNIETWKLNKNLILDVTLEFHGNHRRTGTTSACLCLSNASFVDPYPDMAI